MYYLILNHGPGECIDWLDNMHGHDASSLISGLKMNALNKTLVTVNLDRTLCLESFPHCHVVTKVVSIYWSNKVTLPCRY